MLSSHHYIFKACFSEPYDVVESCTSLPSSSVLNPLNIDPLFESPLAAVDVRTSSSFLYPNIVAGIISEAEDRIHDILTNDAPSSSNAVTEQLNRISNAVTSILEHLDSAWLRTRQLSFENQHLEHLYGRSIVDRQENVNDRDIGQHFS